MFLCGREEPIQANGMLYAYNERLSGVSAELLSAILDQWNTELTWVTARRYFPSGEGVAGIVAFRQRHNMKADTDIEVHARQAEAASQAAIKQFGEEGWAIFHDDALLVATKNCCQHRKDLRTSVLRSPYLAISHIRIGTAAGNIRPAPAARLSRGFLYRLASESAVSRLVGRSHLYHRLQGNG